MKNLTLVLGPKDMKTVLDAVQGAAHRIKVELQYDEAKGEITSVLYYPVDRNYDEITSTATGDLRRMGCPYPPECDTISFKISAGTASASEFAECVKKVDAKSSNLM